MNHDYNLSGLALSFLRAPITPEECSVDLEHPDPIQGDKGDNLKPLDNSVPAFPGSDEDDFEPKIITDPNLKPRVDLEANKKKVVRSRYISTELGIRERLVSAIITERDSVNTLGNKYKWMTIQGLVLSNSTGLSREFSLSEISDNALLTQ